MKNITITRALAELKTLEARFNKKVSELKTVAVSVGGKLIKPNNMYLKEDFEKQSKSDLQSVIDLYNNICAIRKAIDKSNSTTTIEFMGTTMTIQEALVHKRYTGLRKDLLDKLKKQYNTTSDVVSIEQRKLEDYLEDLHKSLNPESGKQVDYEALDSAARKSREVSLVDPCDIQDKIKKLEEEVEKFSTEIDYVLSTSNSTTFIEIAD